MRTEDERLRVITVNGRVISGADPRDPIAFLEAQHGVQLDLCDMLEQIADDLPHSVSRQHMRSALSGLRRDFPMRMSCEGTVFVPLLRRRAERRTWLVRALDQLESEQQTDTIYGQEVADALDELASRGTAGDPEILGYMLRCFFLASRRHLAWEGAVVVPQARALLTPDDLEEMTERFQEALNRFDAEASP